MTVENQKGSRIISDLDATPMSPADAGLAGGRVRYWCETVEVTAGASATSTYVLARLPSNARLTGLSKIHWDDLASSGSPTVDVGIFNPPEGAAISDDDDALAGGLDVAGGAGSAGLVGDIGNLGQRLWAFVSGQSSDPGGLLEIRATLKAAAANSGGTLTIELFYTVD